MIDKLLMTAIKNRTHYYTQLIALSLPIVFLTIFQAVSMGWIIDAVFLKRTPLQQLIFPLALLACVFILRPFFNGLFEWQNRKETALAKQNLRAQITHALRLQLIYQGQDQDEFQDRVQDQNHITGRYATLACEGVEHTDAYYAEFVPQIFIMIINTIFVLGFAFYLDWISALIMMVTAPLIPLFMMLIGKTAEGVHQKQWQTLKRMNGHLMDLLRGMTTLHYFERHLSQVESVRQTSENFRKKTMSVMKLTFLSALTLELTATLSTAVIAVSLGVRLLYGQLSFLSALIILLMTPEYYTPLRQLGLKYHAALNAKSVSSQLKSLLDQMPNPNAAEIQELIEIQSNMDTQKSNRPADSSSLSIEHAHMDNSRVFSLHAIQFTYSNGKNIFSNLNLEIHTGDRLAIVGKSGVGKTTLLKILMGVLKPTCGKIYLFEHDITTYPESFFYDSIAFVAQKSKVFNGSVLDNLKFGRPNASVKIVEKYCALTGFDAIIHKLECGYETILGEGHQSLSGGESQLLSLTRACIRETPIFILDEPTSAVDPESEKRIVEALAKIATDKTLIIASHREAVVNLCHQKLELGGEADV
ncbi:thiol reductant ABC exporter subunit CydD [Fusibacter ferrireducens]|uniref:Thiol reductant ABC exporter subunit CydD n=1 Tax=Fusibacter ferrireducens TaxID=2785058 RepID=A0ABR9ZUT3_9FIRM|nr:thiol reductant ABC exporter subunit CydD [Fusibacter ferrireducens]MBF4694228.1 thiol reductant ABC exporter subunit CydD [Fusibacter ferrireducens]